ncbi:MAG: tRNA-dihydrouridine synthase family protein [Krumholzibacteria bacterium]|nr:tRNA-dihydrouridine synthase family protein [Candidatus Krumholzibacteria bacterium]
MAAEDRRAFFREVVALAPMATGGNLPYRRLCKEFGAALTCSEMVLADKLVKGGERPLLRSHPSEDRFGIQFTGKHEDVMAEAARIAVANGARFIDLNFGCPIDLVVRRGGGAALLKKPARLARLVEAVRQAVDVPLSVKIRIGYSVEKLNCVEVATAAVAAGADAIGVHGRTRAQRYRLSARWDLVDQVQQAVGVPVLGNGDILTPWDLARRRRETAVRSFLVARGALIKPWIFRELAAGEPWNPTTAERWAVMRRWCDFALEHFGDDAKGLARVERFFLWHLGFWHRWRPYTEADFRAQLPDSLIQARSEPVDGDGDAALLASGNEDDHRLIFGRVLDRDYPAV